MPFTIVDVTLAKQSGGCTADGPDYRETYLVKFTGGYSVAALVRNTDPALPKVGQFHADDQTAIVTRVDPELHPDSPGEEGIATYEVTYGPVPAEQRGTANLHPLSRPPRIAWGGVDRDYYVRKDLQGRAIANSAGTLYDGGLPVKVRGGECTITLNRDGNPAATCTLYSYVSNSQVWYGVDVWNALIGKIEAQQVAEEFQGNVVNYWQMTFPIAFRRDGWRHRLIDHGAKKKVPDPAHAGKFKQEQIFDDHGFPVHQSLLDGSGQPLVSGIDPIEYPAGGFQVYDEVDFSVLALPNPFA
jgi:hypothetical protein